MFRKILVPFDGSRYSEAAAQVAKSWAERCDANLMLACAVPREIAPDPPTVAGSPLPSPGASERGKQAANLEQYATQLGGVSETRVVVGEPGQAIVQLAKDEQVGLIVMGTHGLTGLKHLVLGSVAEQVVRHAPCPVLTISRTALERDHPSTAQALATTIGPFG